MDLVGVSSTMDTFDPVDFKNTYSIKIFFFTLV